MKTEFKAKFLQHFNQKNREEGFTLIELLVVVIIIGILAAVALPSLLSQTNKAKQVEARNNVGAMNRAQQAVYLEKQQFASDKGTLGIGLSDSVNYSYAISDASGTSATNKAVTAKDTLKNYAGYVYTTTASNSGIVENLTLARLCESTNPGAADTTVFTQAASADCGSEVQLGN